MAVPNRKSEDAQAARSATTDWRSLYDVEDLCRVEAFVARHPGLDELVSQVHDELRARFESAARLQLSVSQGPDSDTGEPDEWLTITIWTDREWHDVQVRLRRFEAEWWLDAMPRGEPLIAILPRFR